MQRAYTLQQVRLFNQEPEQQHTSVGFLRSIDYHKRRMLKHPKHSAFHSKSEFWHALLLEANPDVLRYTPQPFAMKIKNRRYIPDIYYESQRYGRFVGEIKPKGQFNQTQDDVLTAFWHQRGIQFIQITNESILAKTVMAKNWHFIVRNLVIARDLDTTPLEEELQHRCFVNKSLTFGDIINVGNRQSTYNDEIALYRLLHQGRIEAPLALESISPAMVIS